jgi:hypothetical protein
MPLVEVRAPPRAAERNSATDRAAEERRPTDDDRTNHGGECRKKPRAKVRGAKLRGSHDEAGAESDRADDAEQRTEARTQYSFRQSSLTFQRPSSANHPSGGLQVEE